MQVKRYEAASIQDALTKIKSDLGPDAIVLSTKRLPGKKNLLEVTAARDDCREMHLMPEGHEEQKEKERFSEAGDMLACLRKDMEELKSLVRSVRREKISEEIAELKESMNVFFDVLGFSGKPADSAQARLYRYLVSRGISKARVCKLLEEMKGTYPAQDVNDYEKSLKIAARLLSRTCKETSDERGKRVKVFVGPTGVGKTTTLAKLAARYAYEQKLTVGLITTDTFRIAAAEQLKVYARIMGLPLEVAGEKEPFRKSLERLRDRDIILVDTPGRGRSDDDSLAKLNDIVSGDGDRETNLLLSLTSSRENLMDVVARYGKFACDQIIFTKLDECNACGVLYDVMEQSGKPVSYIATGQNVPRDIERVNPARLAELILWH